MDCGPLKGSIERLFSLNPNKECLVSDTMSWREGVLTGGGDRGDCSSGSQIYWMIYRPRFLWQVSKGLGRIGGYGRWNHQVNIL